MLSIPNPRPQREWEDRFSVLLDEQIGHRQGLRLIATIDPYITRLDDRRWYSIAETTRIQEVADYGAPFPTHAARERGYGAHLAAVQRNRFRERDGGVYVELEAIVLSRDIPFSFAGWSIRSYADIAVFTS